MTGAAPARVGCACGEPRGHRTDCPEFLAAKARTLEHVRRADEIREARANGTHTLRSAEEAIRRWVIRHHAWCSPKAIPLDVDGSGRPSRALDDPARVEHAAVCAAVRIAQDDDRDRNPTKLAPLEEWLAAHFFGVGRNSSLTYAEIADRFPGRWTEVEVARRMERAIRVIRKRLRDRKLLGRGGDDGA